jgi:hypothetical protein
MSSQQQMIIGTAFPDLIDSAETLRDNLRDTYSGYTINSEVSDKGIYMIGSGNETRQVTINTSELAATSFRIWCIGAGGATISVWGAGYGGGGTYADHDNTGGNMVCTLGGRQGGWSGYSANYNDGDSVVTYDGSTMTGEGSSGGGTLGNSQGSYSTNFSGGAGSSGGSSYSGSSQYGGGGGAPDGVGVNGGDGYNYGGGGAADSGRSNNSMNGGGGSSYGYGCRACCSGAAYYGCSPTTGHGGGGAGADIVYHSNGEGMVVIQWGSGIKSVLSSYSSGAQNF